MSSGCWPETNTNLLPVATTTWVYISGIGRSSGLMHSSVIDLIVTLARCARKAGAVLPRGADRPSTDATHAADGGADLGVVERREPEDQPWPDSTERERRMGARVDVHVGQGRHPRGVVRGFR